MVKITFFALIILCVVCLMLFATTTLTNGGVVYKTFATHPDVPPSGGLLMWAKTDGTFQTTNSSGTDSGMGGGGGGAGPAVSAYMSGTSPTFPGSTATPIPFNNNDFDTGSMHSTTVNNTRFVAPSAGYYLLTGTFQVTGGGSNFAIGNFLLTAAAGGTTSVIGSNAGVAAANAQVVSTSIAHLLANDYVEYNIYPTGGTVQIFTFDVAPGAAVRVQMIKLF